MRYFDNCTREQQEQLLNWFFYRINSEQRTELRAALPQAYDAFTGKITMPNSFNAFVEQRKIAVQQAIADIDTDDLLAGRPMPACQNVSAAGTRHA